MSVDTPIRARKTGRGSRSPKAVQSRDLQDYLKERCRSSATPNAYVMFLGMAPSDTTAVVKELAKGFRFSSLEHLQDSIGLSPKEAADLLDIPARTVVRRKKEGRLHLYESERMLRLARLFAAVIDLCEGDEGTARQWLRTPQSALNDETPLQMSRTEIGAREVENLIGRLEHGVFF